MSIPKHFSVAVGFCRGGTRWNVGAGFFRLHLDGGNRRLRQDVDKAVQVMLFWAERSGISQGKKKHLQPPGYLPPKTNMSPENQWLEDDISY